MPMIRIINEFTPTININNCAQLNCITYLKKIEIYTSINYNYCFDSDNGY